MTTADESPAQVHVYEAAIRRLAPERLPPDEHYTPACNTSPLEWARQLGVAPQIERQALADTYGIRLLDSLSELSPWPKFVEQTPISWCRQNQVVALLDQTDSPVIAISDPSAWQQIEIINRHMHVTAGVILTADSEITAAINRSYETKKD
ncbi:MAG: hypothetical protein KDA96_18640, partial [Planctomycetaceae bacterium]|nr:hypothetical protein [Planctomycetaceae bacterium]